MNKSKDIFSLNEEQQTAVLEKLHHNQNLSITNIAQIYDTYPNKIRRLADALGIKRKNRSETQKAVLATGVATHPTKGKQHSEASKVKISNTVAKSWAEIDDDERERRREVSKQAWDNRSEADKTEFWKKGHDSVRKASKTGSKFEKLIFDALTAAGYKVSIHTEQTLANVKLHLDLLLTDINTIIEVDGPSHFRSVWGEEALKRTKKSDNQKNGLVLNAGYCIIRVRQTQSLSKVFVRNTISAIISQLQKIEKKFPKAGNRLFYIGEIK